MGPFWLVTNGYPRDEGGFGYYTGAYDIDIPGRPHWSEFRGYAKVFKTKKAAFAAVKYMQALWEERFSEFNHICLVDYMVVKLNAPLDPSAKGVNCLRAKRKETDSLSLPNGKREIDNRIGDSEEPSW